MYIAHKNYIRLDKKGVSDYRIQSEGSRRLGCFGIAEKLGTESWRRDLGAKIPAVERNGFARKGHSQHTK